MPSLKSFRNRIASVKAIRKITKAQQMVAASKLRRAQEAAEAARPYAEKMENVIASLAGGMEGNPGAPRLLTGTGKDAVHLVIVATADRGLCGAFNSNIVRKARGHIEQLLRDGKQVKILCVGRKGRDQLRRNYSNLIIDAVDFAGIKRIGFADANKIARRVLDLFEAGEFDVAAIIYSRFRSVMSQVPTVQQLIPAPIEATAPAVGPHGNVYVYEPDETEILHDLLPRNIGVQVFRALLENVAGEMGAKMTAMDGATRNAGEVIDKLTMQYNRSRQAMITKELIEIISGAEAL
ncbi:MAG TPA: F0F1 ATP synthase subunit gamma [Rhizomicrobium sp.]|jgi:F-type H+-transporting ATPase subunit gamma|nr:F0F1 ATP synthase subunit gamma [Rhizomicrobium sp.]